MSPRCPWCDAALTKDQAQKLGNVAQPSPCCGKPISKSIWQLLFEVLLLMPLSAIIFYLLLLAFESENMIGPMLCILAVCGLAIILHRFIPVIANPSRGIHQRGGV